jgi:hypothetical protein
MKPAEVGIAHQKFLQEIESLRGDELLDRWIALQDGSEINVPNLGILKCLSLEAVLHQTFGFGNWQAAVKARREAKNA